MPQDYLSLRVASQLNGLPHASEAQRYHILRSIRTRLDPANALATCSDDTILSQCVRGFRAWGGSNVMETVQVFTHQRNNIRYVRKSLSALQDPSISLNRIIFTYQPLDSSDKIYLPLKTLDPSVLSDLQIERARQAAIGWSGFFPFLTHLLGCFSPRPDLITMKALVESVAWSLTSDADMHEIRGLFIHQGRGITERIYLSFFEDGSGEDTFLFTPITSSPAGEHLKASLKRARWAAARYLRQLSTDFDAASLMSYDLLLKIGDHYHAAGIEGGSLSLTVAVMLVAHALQLPIPEYVALTGEIDANMMVEPVTGVDKKIRAAMETDLSCVIIPAGNMLDIRSISLDHMEIFGVRSLEDACNFLFRDELRDAGYQAFPIEAASTPAYTPFSGRRNELVQLQQQINKTLSGQGALSIIHGESGVGKTRLMEEVRKYALDEGLFVLTGACLYRQGAIPYWPFISAMMSLDDRDRRLADKNWAGKIAEVKALLKNVGDLDARILQVQLFDHLLSLVEILTETAGVVIWIEDLQWSDSGTLQLVHHLARQTQNRRFRLVVTYRSNDTIRDDSQAETYFLDVLQQCGTEGLSDTLALEPMNESECGLLVAVLVKERAIPVWFTDLVYKETQGNPLFIIELIKWWKDQNLIKDGRVGIDWQIFEDQKGVIPPRTLDVIAHRLRQLTEEERTLLDIAAVGGEQFDIADVIAISAEDKIKILQCCQRLEKKYGIIKHTRQNTYQFTHSKIQEFIYANLSEVLRIEYHRLWGQMLLLRKETGEEVPVERLATHLYQGDDCEAALPYLIEAGKQTQKMCAFREAQWYWEQARALVEDHNNGNTGDKIKVFLKLSWVYYELGHWEMALMCNQKVINESRNIDLSSHARAQLQIGAIYLAQSKWDMANERFCKSKEMYTKIDDRIGLAAANNYIGNVAVFQSKWDIALRFYQIALSHVIPNKNVARTAIIKNNVGHIFLRKGDYDTAIGYFIESLDTHKKINNITGMADAFTNLGVIYEIHEDWDNALKCHNESVEFAERTGNTRQLWNVYINVARVYARTGDIKLAELIIYRATNILHASPNKLGIAEAKRVEGLIRYLKNDWASAEILFDESETLCKETNDMQGQAETICERAYMSIEKGNYNQALSLLEQAKEAFVDIGAKGEVAIVTQKMITIKNKLS